MNKTAYAFGKFEHMLSERATFALVRELAADCEEFVDVGANEGAFTFLVHVDHPQVRLHWFEPDRALARRLATKVAVPLRSATAISFPQATISLLVRFFFKNLSDDLSSSLTSLFTQKHVTRAETVETISLAEYFRIRGIGDAMVKVDVEGSGVKVW